VNQIIYAGKHLLTYSVTRHAHASWELIYCTGGSGQFVFKTGTLPYQAHDLVIIPPQTPHQNESVTGFTNIHLNMREPRLHLQEPTLLREEGTLFLLDAFEAVFYLFSSNPAGNSRLLDAYGDLIVSLIEDRLDTPAHSSVVGDIKSMIIRNYPDEEFALDQYLHSLPFNYDYLRKLFKSEMGITPHQFLSDTRLKAAAERLSFPDPTGSSISEVAHLCGFQDPLYFTRMFRKKFGLSPTEYQKAQRDPAAPEFAEEFRPKDA
jgi:AraC-like DNA-binding protein